MINKAQKENSWTFHIILQELEKNNQQNIWKIHLHIHILKYNGSSGNTERTFLYFLLWSGTWSCDYLVLFLWWWNSSPGTVFRVNYWFWERLRAGGEGGNRGLDSWTATQTQRTWIGANSGRQWRTGKPGVLQSMGSQSRTQLSDWTTTKSTGLKGRDIPSM